MEMHYPDVSHFPDYLRCVVNTAVRDAGIPCLTGKQGQVVRDKFEAVRQGRVRVKRAGNGVRGTGSNVLGKEAEQLGGRLAAGR